MLVINESGELCYPLGIRKSMKVFNKGMTIGFVGNIGVDEEDDREEDFNVRLTLGTDSVVRIQERDHAVRMLKRKLVDGVQSEKLKEGYLAQFRRYYKAIDVKAGVVVINRSGNWVPVIPFLLFVEIAYKVYISLAHIGRLKLVELIQNHFWHPSLDRVCRDITTSCSYCQLYKIGSQRVQPPTLKIKARYPFDLVAMDLLQFTKSSLGNAAVLMIVDHFSKFVVAVPIRDKTSSSVVRALSRQVFPQLVRLPDRILTDNGPEFRSVEFNELLGSFNISHVYSTRYRAAGNGAVERVNRTITQLLKPLAVDNPSSWDTKIGRAVIVYNNTYHSQIGATPSQVIVGQAHNVDSKLPIETEELEFWEEGHSSFQSFKLGQKVAYKINRIGNQLKDKLAKKYEGPYKVVKIQVNKVTYEVEHCRTREVRKVHHRQLKAWTSPPKYLQRYIESDSNVYDERNDIMREIRSSESSDTEGETGWGIVHCSSSSSSSDTNSSYEGEMKGASKGSEAHRRSAGSLDDSLTDGETAWFSKKAEKGTRLKNLRSMDIRGMDRQKIVDTREEVGNRELPRESKSLPVVPHLELKELGRLHCSEPVEYGMCQGLVEDLYSNLKMNVDNYRLDFNFLDWDVSDVLGEEDWVCSETNQGNKYSTPIVNRDRGSNVDKEVDSNNSRGNSLQVSEEFLQWIEQSINLQEELLGQVLSSENRKSSRMADRGSNSKQVNNEITFSSKEEGADAFSGFVTATSFSGFEQDDWDFQNRVKADVLRRMREQLVRTRRGVQEFRSINLVLRQRWRNQYMQSEDRFDIVSGLESEVSDIIAPLPGMSTCSSEHMITRAMGRVAEHPHVQQGILEYRCRNRKE